jgi:SAM-dependent methyltransferase
MIFGESYAAAYDALYQAKDYDIECELLERVFSRRDPPVRTVLDLGCGTGNHTVRLAQRGFDVTGVDASPDMLRLARKKVDQVDVEVRLHQADIRDFALDRQFDAALMMFAVLGYQLGNADVLHCLRAIRRHLRNAGLLVFDVWYGPAVLTQKPGERLRVIRDNGHTVLRTARSSLHTFEHQCAVDFSLWQAEGPAGMKETPEQHRMRYFFPQELALFLEITGFRMLSLTAFPEIERPPDEDTWNVLVVAEAVA